MNAATVMPTWLVVALAVATPVLAFLAAVAGSLVTRKAALELEARSRRDEVLSHLKWAAELAVSEDARRADLGVRELQALAESSLLDTAERSFIDAAMESVYAEPAAELHDAEQAGEVGTPTPDVPLTRRHEGRE